MNGIPCSTAGRVRISEAVKTVSSFPSNDKPRTETPGTCFQCRYRTLQVQGEILPGRSAVLPRGRAGFAGSRGGPCFPPVPRHLVTVTVFLVRCTGHDVLRPAVASSERWGCPLTTEPVLDSVITCPQCGYAKHEVMPTDACLWSYECTRCHALMHPSPGDCCVFCSYGSVPCPPIQVQGAK